MGVVNARMAIEYGDCYAWNKFYRRDLFQTVRFPEGRVHEDLATTHRAIFAAKHIVMIPGYLYYHIYRKDSITNSESAINRRDCYISAVQRYNDLLSYGYNREELESMLVFYALGLLVRYHPSDDPIYIEAETMVDSVQSVKLNLTLKKKIMLLIWKTDKQLFHFLCRILGQKEDRKKGFYG